MNVTCREEKRRERTRISVECWDQLEVEFRDRHTQPGCVRLLAILCLMFSKRLWRLGRINAPDSNSKKHIWFCGKTWWWWTPKGNEHADENLNIPRLPSSLSGEAWALKPWSSNTFWMNRNTIASVGPPCLTGIWSQTNLVERLKPEEWRLIGLGMTITCGVMLGCLCGSYSSMEQHFTIGVKVFGLMLVLDEKSGGHCTYLNPSTGNHGHSLSWQIVLEIFSCTKVLQKLNSEHSGCEFMCAAGIQSRAFIRLELALSVCYRACLASPNWSGFVCRWC